MQKSESIIIMIHCEQFTGYAVGVLEHIFFKSALSAGYSEENIYWSYPIIHKPAPNIIECKFNNGQNYPELAEFVRQNNIKQIIAFDMAYPADILPVLRKAGIESIISYWGASMSSLNSGLKLALKKMEWYLRSHKPDFFIFESDAMRRTATHGRGVPQKNTAVVVLGVDTHKYTPAYQTDTYAHATLGIPTNRKIVFYSGHMEERKGVRIIMQAALKLASEHKLANIHFVICGNKNNEADTYIAMLENSPAKEHVTFAGYRNDISALMRSSSIGVIASTGWDSFTMSSVEMMASGLPMIVSNLQGLGETIEHEVNGYHITPGDSSGLAEYLVSLTSNAALASKFSAASRQRAEKLFSQEHQIEKIAQYIAAKK
ncbi:MAG TPA: glycosyltransferase family 4 protein [Cellvibrio sp.]|mgnify:CR=1 FL=1|nr:glycosyltransferase family 4 protein [Cellvibrio sp.]